VISRFGAYEILHELSRGGMGEVLLGRRRGPGTFEQLVAIKTIRPEYANAAAVRAMFLDEAAILARLNHPGVATVHDFGEQAGTLYMVMEYVAGVSFRSLIGRMPPAVAARAIAEACRGLHAAHELRELGGQQLGLVHRDISPDNLMLGFDGHVKVIDFGIALIKNRQAPVTEFGTVKGKPPYMSPEQVKNEAMDRRSDVFSLGVVLHELLTGAPLFDGDSIYAIAIAVQAQEIRPPSHVLGRELPLGLDAVVMNALDRDRACRTPTAAALAEQLEQVIGVAGDETLEAWAERELAGPRDAQRTWLAGIIAGREVVAPIGRPTGAVTALPGQPADALGRDHTQLAPIAAPQVTDEPVGRATPTHLPAPIAEDDDAFARPRSRLWIPIVLALVLLGAVVGGIAMFSSSAPHSAARDAAMVALEPDAAHLDAPVGAQDPADAPVPTPLADAATPPPDARVRTVARPDAGTRPVPRDAAVLATAAIDAAPPPPPAGFGKLIAKHRPGGAFLNVIVDGKFLQGTPIFGGRIAAGRHTIELVEPDTGKVVVSKTVTVADGESVTVAP
jgi:eukaryotic-like serine/threonine-protein kinase